MRRSGACAGHGWTGPAALVGGSVDPTQSVRPTTRRPYAASVSGPVTFWALCARQSPGGQQTSSRPYAPLLRQTSRMSPSPLTRRPRLPNSGRCPKPPCRAPSSRARMRLASQLSCPPCSTCMAGRRSLPLPIFAKDLRSGLPEVPDGGHLVSDDVVRSPPQPFCPPQSPPRQCRVSLRLRCRCCSRRSAME